MSSVTGSKGSNQPREQSSKEELKLTDRAKSPIQKLVKDASSEGVINKDASLLLSQAESKVEVPVSEVSLQFDRISKRASQLFSYVMDEKDTMLFYIGSVATNFALGEIADKLNNSKTLEDPTAVKLYEDMATSPIAHFISKVKQNMQSFVAKGVEHGQALAQVRVQAQMTAEELTEMQGLSESELLARPVGLKFTKLFLIELSKSEKEQLPQDRRAALFPALEILEGIASLKNHKTILTRIIEQVPIDASDENKQKTLNSVEVAYNKFIANKLNDIESKLKFIQKKFLLKPQENDIIIEHSIIDSSQKMAEIMFPAFIKIMEEEVKNAKMLLSREVIVLQNKTDGHKKAEFFKGVVDLFRSFYGDIKELAKAHTDLMQEKTEIKGEFYFCRAKQEIYYSKDSKTREHKIPKDVKPYFDKVQSQFSALKELRSQALSDPALLENVQLPSVGEQIERLEAKKVEIEKEKQRVVDEIHQEILAERAKVNAPKEALKKQVQEAHQVRMEKQREQVVQRQQDETTEIARRDIERAKEKTTTKLTNENQEKITELHNDLKALSGLSSAAHSSGNFSNQITISLQNGIKIIIDDKTLSHIQQQRLDFSKTLTETDFQRVGELKSIGVKGDISKELLTVAEHVNHFLNAPDIVVMQPKTQYQAPLLMGPVPNPDSDKPFVGFFIRPVTGQSDTLRIHTYFDLGKNKLDLYQKELNKRNWANDEIRKKIKQAREIV